MQIFASVAKLFIVSVKTFVGVMIFFLEQACRLLQKAFYHVSIEQVRRKSKPIQRQLGLGEIL